jgi:hypothetical protein
VALLLGSATPAAAQEGVHLHVIPHYVKIDEAFPIPFVDHRIRKNSTAFGLEAELSMGWPVSVTANFNYWGVELGCSEETCGSSGTSIDFGINGWPTGTERRIQPYVAVGIGVFDGRFLTRRSMYRAGLGVDLPLNQYLGLRLEGRYHGFRHENTFSRAGGVVTEAIWENFAGLQFGARFTL